jgi:hypothetical protein
MRRSIDNFHKQGLLKICGIPAGPVLSTAPGSSVEFALDSSNIQWPAFTRFAWLFNKSTAPSNYSRFYMQDFIHSVDENFNVLSFVCFAIIARPKDPTRSAQHGIHGQEKRVAG